MIETVKSLLFTESERETIYECRRCGTGVDSPSSTCPSCGNEDIASFHTR
ncbi:hypothetical protein [Natronosalvus rutilus]|uniref:Rubrerythrin-like domain-containing protein n=1 Tax=Natronosalvus rutilus TaxID=2953753 RepID=A0A9E7N899_9EURY|nr:hypothetical protein [Natronosalvus rutilus]UTF52354.1 hypothetical protein NGM29_11185 [Natronosalvus rutilus]